MRHELYDSLEAMLAPESLSAIEGQTVRYLHRRPLHSGESISGSRLEYLQTNGPSGQRYVLKRISPEWDWIMRATDDRRGRAVVSWQIGLLDRLPIDIVHGLLACARDGGGWALLLRDFSAALVPPGEARIAEDEHERFVDAMAGLHAAFWGQPHAADPALGFCTLRQRYSFLGPQTQRRETLGREPLADVLLEGWGLLEQLVEPTTSGLVRALLEDPRPLCEALDRSPQTVVHGDWKVTNLGLLHGQPARVVLLDWALAGPAPPAVDLAWYLAINSARLPTSKEATIAHYEQSLGRRLDGRFQSHWWRPQLELSLLGAFLQLGWAKLHGALRAESEAVRARERAEVAWWSERVRAALRWL